MLVLGLGTEGDSGAAIVEDGRILAAVNEERISRMKLVHGFPRESISEVLRLADVASSDLDGVLVAARQDRLVEELEPFRSWFERWEEGDLVGRLKRAAGSLSRFHRYLPFLEPAYYLLQEPTFRKRRRGIRRILHNELDVTCPIEFVDHHLAHVASAYFTSGFEDALVVSLDGGGDGRSGLVYSARGGSLDARDDFVREFSALHSLGNYYAYVTHICGFEAHKHEGKITGLSARGEPRYAGLLREFVDVRAGELTNRAGLVFRAAVKELRRRLPDGWTKEDLAASVQRHFEDVVVRLVRHWRRRTEQRNVALAGGVFANVRVNQAVHRIPGVERVFVHPGMTDGGLPVGGALTACIPGILPETMELDPEPLETVFLGTDLAEADIRHALSKHGLEGEPHEGPIEERIAELLADGYVVARANGRMENGPRALGNRSILYHPTDPSVRDWLNAKLRRTEFMPFAPAVLAEHADRCFLDVEGARHTAEFMTITFDCTQWMREHLPGVVHVDGSARPQLVRRDRNPSLHRIIEAFRRRTGLPAVINTSFNMHEEPIVRTAEDCVRAFLRGKLDALAIGDFLVRHPAGVARDLTPATPVDVGAEARL
ncbi:MAG: carbamoyltransferase [Gemmatimonadota bacterium]